MLDSMGIPLDKKKNKRTIFRFQEIS